MPQTRAPSRHAAPSPAPQDERLNKYVSVPFTREEYRKLQLMAARDRDDAGKPLPMSRLVRKWCMAKMDKAKTQSG